MSELKPCKIYYASDSQICETCGSVWDANDPYPPTCGVENEKKPGVVLRFLIRLFGTKVA